MKGLLFTYLLTYGGAAASLFQPFYGLLIYFCFAIIKPESMWYWAVPSGNYSRIVAIALLAGWAIQGFGDWNFGRARPIVMIMLGCWLWWILGAIAAQNQYVAWRSVEAQSKIYLPVLVGITLIKSVRQLKILAWVLMLSQAYVAWELNLSYFAGYNRLTDAGFGGMDNNSAAIGLVAGSGLAFFLGLDQKKLWKQLLCFAAAALMAHAVMFSFSRGGMLGLIMMGGVTFFIVPKRPKDYAIFAVAVVIGLRLAGPAVIARFTTTFTSEEQRDASAQSRLDLWKACFDMMVRFPILGAGPNHFPEYVSEYGFPPGKEAHSLWMQQGAEMGFPGLAMFVGFYVATVSGLFKLLWRSRDLDPWFADSARMVIGSLSGFAVSASFVSLESLELPYYIAMLGAGALKCADLEISAQGISMRSALIAPGNRSSQPLAHAAHSNRGAWHA